jgi:energy-coupling factor transporter ATP-binding protein EcfA2
MYVRLGFSVAINVDPDILLVDEVLAVGDEEFQNRCNERFSTLRAEGKTIVVVSHSLGSIQAICDEVAWLDQGVLRGVGAAGDVVDQYLTEVHRERGGSLPATTGRWGSQEITLDEMEVLDADGATSGLPLRTGQPALFRFHYQAVGRVTQPMFTLAIHTLDGTTITNPTTHEPQAVPHDLEGRGHIDLVVDHLPLVPGTYDLSGAITDDAALHVYDHRHRAVRFDVESAIPRQSGYGLVSFNGRWELHEGAPG